MDGLVRGGRRMERKKLPVGLENFDELRKEGFYYVDKTGLIRDLLNNWGKVNLFTRPRRFGKTLNMSMLKCFFEIGADRTLFDGLAIYRVYLKNSLRLHNGVFSAISASKNLDLAPLNLRFPSLN